MTTQRIGFVDKVEGDVAHALRRSTLILSRQEYDLPRYGRAAVRSISSTGSARIVGTGVVICYGSPESDVARQMLSTADTCVVVVTKKTPRKDGEIERACERLLGSGKKVERVVVKRGAAFAGNCSPGGVFRIVDVHSPTSFSTAPTIPRPKVEPVEVSRPRLARSRVDPVEVSRPRITRAAVLAPVLAAPRLARPPSTGDRTIAESTPAPSADVSAPHSPLTEPEEPVAISAPPEPVEAPLASPVASTGAED